MATPRQSRSARSRRTVSGARRVGLLDRDALARATQQLLGRSDAFLGARHPMLICEPGGRIVDLDDEAVRVYGWSGKELLGRPVAALIAPEWRDRVEAIFARCRQGEAVRDAEAMCWTREEVRVPALLTCVPLLDAREEIAGVAVSALEIGELVRSSLLLRELEKHLPIVLWLFALDPPRIVYVSPSYPVIWGRSPEALRDHAWDWLRAVVPEDRPRVEDAFARLLAGEPYDEQYRIALPGGGSRAIHARGSPVHDATARLTHAVGIAEDVTAQQEVQERLRAAAADARHAEESERRALAGDLHDSVGQLLAVARMRAAELCAESKGLPSSSAAEETASLVARAEELVRSLTFELRPLSLHENGLAAAIDELTDELRQRFGLVASVFDDGLAKPLDQDQRIALFRGVRELLINVARHARTDRAEVRITREDGAVVVSVEDAGAGFVAAAQPAGGFGLRSLRERIEDLGGRVELESAPGRGTRVRMIVPL